MFKPGIESFPYYLGVGRRGQVLPTAIGDIPVFNNVREGLDAGGH